MKYSIKLKASVLALLATTAFSTQALATNYDRTYRVTITNVTQAIQFTPVLGVSHNSAASLFELGQRPSDELASIAEGGNIAPLRSVLDSSSAVSSTAATDGLLDAGKTVEFEITADYKDRRFSMAAMLLPTNDGFVALDSVWLPRRGSRTYEAKAYDAGSEVNDQLCANIPGPTCGGDGAFVQVDGEGFVHIHNGIHEQGDIPGGSARYDWRNPVATVKITRIR